MEGLVDRVHVWILECFGIDAKVEKIRAKQAARPKHSPLPQHLEQPDAVREAVRILNSALTPRYGLQGIYEDFGRDTNAYNYHAMKYWQQQHESLKILIRTALRALEGGEV